MTKDEKEVQIAELKKQKREIEDKIRQLTMPDVVTIDKVKFEKKESIDIYVWQVAALAKYTFTEYEREKTKYGTYRSTRNPITSYEKERWSVFIREKTKQDMLEKIDIIIRDLNTLKTKLASDDVEVS